MKTVAVVPMKLNNQRLPQKNIKPFTNGKPLCHYVLATLLSVEEIDNIYVYCSNPDIQEYVPSGVSCLRRSSLLDRDTTSMNEVLQSFASDVFADVYILAHATAPFIKRSSIEKGLQAVTSEAYDSAFTVKKVQDFLWRNGVPFNYDLDKIPRTQDLPVLYMETSGFYIYRREVISTWNRRIGKNPRMIEVSEIESIDIDEEEDFIMADAIYNHVILNKIETGGGRLSR